MSAWAILIDVGRVSALPCINNVNFVILKADSFDQCYAMMPVLYFKSCLVVYAEKDWNLKQKLVGYLTTIATILTS